MSDTIQNVLSLNPTELIKWCRQMKTTLNYSNQKISQLSGVPIGTIDRIMAGKYTEFKYSSIQPIVACLLGYGEKTPEPDKTDKSQGEFYYNTIEGYKLVVENKNQEIDILKREINTLLKEKDFLIKENQAKEEHLRWMENILTETKTQLRNKKNSTSI